MIEGETGYMGNVGDVETMSRHAITILQSEKSLQHFKDGAFRQATNFDIHNIIPLYEKLYEDVLEGELASS